MPAGGLRRARALQGAAIFLLAWLPSPAAETAACVCMHDIASIWPGLPACCVSPLQAGNLPPSYKTIVCADVISNGGPAPACLLEQPGGHASSGLLYVYRSFEQPNQYPFCGTALMPRALLPFPSHWLQASAPTARPAYRPTLPMNSGGAQGTAAHPHRSRSPEQYMPVHSRTCST